MDVLGNIVGLARRGLMYGKVSFAFPKSGKELSTWNTNDKRQKESNEIRTNFQNHKYSHVFAYVVVETYFALQWCYRLW